jgi:hypothetical protein
MSEAPPPPPPPSPPAGGSSGASQSPEQRFSARVPERVARGATATGFLAFFGPNEFVIDFLQFLSRPANLVARVVMTPAVAEQFLGVLKENLSRYEAQFGPPPAMPKSPTPEKPRPVQEIYDDLKIPEEVVSGVYANTVMVGHTPAEFGLDFITSFIPHAAVSSRVYVAAPRMPQLIDTLSGLIAQYKKQHGGAQIQPGSGQLPPGPPPPQNFGTAPGIPGFPEPPKG